MKKIICVFGTRPEAIKMAPVIKELQKKKEYFDTKIVLIGQHKEMLIQGMNVFGLKWGEGFYLDIMKENQSLHHIISKTISELEFIFDKENPDLVLVQGDTTSALGATIASFYSKIPIGHIEAGLRTFDFQIPFPEEMNRSLIDKVSTLYFCPTKISKENLVEEELSEWTHDVYEVTDNPNCEKIFITGNTVIDAIQSVLNQSYLYKNPYLRQVDFKKRIIMLTIHRRESWDKSLQDICKAIKEIMPKYPGIEIIYPVHPNPIVNITVYSILSNQERIHLISPLDYCDSVKLINDSYAILTDSGGIVEEASYLGTPVLILREKTERPEAVTANSAKLIGTSKKKIIDEINKFLNDKIGYEEMAIPRKIFGDGKASERIVQGIGYYFGIIKERPEDFKGEY